MKDQRPVQKYKFNDAQLLKDGDTATVLGKKKINAKDYWFNAEGQMASGFYMIDETEAHDSADEYEADAAYMYYFGGADDGSMKTGSQSIKDDNGDTYKFYFDTKTGSKGRGITGNQSNKLYYYGRLVVAEDYKYQIATVGGYDYIVNSNGSIQHANSQYKEDGDVLIDARNIKTETKDKDGNYVERAGQYVAFYNGTEKDENGKTIPSTMKYAIHYNYVPTKDAANYGPGVANRSVISNIGRIDIANYVEE